MKLIQDHFYRSREGGVFMALVPGILVLPNGTAHRVFYLAHSNGEHYSQCYAETGHCICGEPNCIGDMIEEVAEVPNAWHPA